MLIVLNVGGACAPVVPLVNPSLILIIEKSNA